MSRGSKKLGILAWSVALIAGAALPAQAATTRAYRIVVTSEKDPGEATFDIMVDEKKDLHSLVYMSPKLTRPRVMGYNDVLNPPEAEKTKYDGLVVTYNQDRPVVVLKANADRFDPRIGGELTLRYLHNGFSKDNPVLKEYPIRIVRDRDEWKVLTDDHSTRITSLCFPVHKEAWVIEVGAETVIPNKSCPKK